MKRKNQDAVFTRFYFADLFEYDLKSDKLLSSSFFLSRNLVYFIVKITILKVFI